MSDTEKLADGSMSLCEAGDVPTTLHTSCGETTSHPRSKTGSVQANHSPPQRPLQGPVCRLYKTQGQGSATGKVISHRQGNSVAYEPVVRPTCVVLCRFLRGGQNTAHIGRGCTAASGKASVHSPAPVRVRPGRVHENSASSPSGPGELGVVCGCAAHFPGAPSGLRSHYLGWQRCAESGKSWTASIRGGFSVRGVPRAWRAVMVAQQKGSW